jgi:hypothetical protein
MVQHENNATMSKELVFDTEALLDEAALSLINNAMDLFRRK